MLHQENIIKYEPVPGEIKNNYFIHHSKQFAKNNLYQIVNSYVKTNAIEQDKLIKLMDEFYLINDLDFDPNNKEHTALYQHFETKFNDILKNLLQRTRSLRSCCFHPLIGVLHYLVGSCKLFKKNKMQEAEDNFIESFRYCGDPQIEFASLISNVKLFLSGDLNSNDLIKAEWYKLICDIKLKKNASLNDPSSILCKIYNMFISKIKSCSEKNSDRNAKISEISEIKGLFEKWKNEEAEDNQDESVLIGYQESLIQSNYLKYTMISNDTNIASHFFKKLIFNKLNESLNFKEENDNQIDYTKQIIKLIIEASKYIHFPYLLEKIIDEIYAFSEDDSLFIQLKKILEKLLEEVKGDDRLLYSFLGDKDIRFAISRLSTEYKRPCELATTDEKCIKTLNKIAKPILMKLCLAISPESIKETCSGLLQQYFNNENISEKLQSECLDFISSICKKNSILDISTKYGPVLDVLYYIIGVSKLRLFQEGEDFNDNDLTNGIYLTSSPEIKKILRFIRALMRLNTGLFIKAKHDLDVIAKQSPEIVFDKESSLEFNKLANILSESLNKHIKMYPSIIVSENVITTSLLQKLGLSILEGKYHEAFALQEIYERFDENKNSKGQLLNYNFWMTILYFRLSNESKQDEQDKYNKALLVHLEETLELSHDVLNNDQLPGSHQLVNTLFRFEEVISNIYKEDNKKYMSLFCNELHKLSFDNVIFQQHISDHCNQSVGDQFNALMLEATQNVSCQSIEEALSNDFIKCSKETVKYNLCQALNKFIDIDDDIKKLVINFYNIRNFDNNSVQQYHGIEQKGLLLLNDLLRKARSYLAVQGFDYWKPMIGILYYIVGTSQLAQGKYKEAQVNLYESFEMSNIIEIVTMSMFSNIHACLNDGSCVSNFIKAKSYRNNSQLKENIKTNENFQKLFKIFENKIITDLYKGESQDIKVKKVSTAMIIFKAWCSEKNAENIKKYEEELLREEHLTYLETSEIILFFTKVIKNQLKTCLNFTKKSQEVPIDYLNVIAHTLLHVNKYIQFNLVIKNLMNEFHSETIADAYCELWELRNVLTEVQKKLKINNLMQCSFYNNEDINFIIERISPKVPFQLANSNEIMIEKIKKSAGPVLVKLSAKVKGKNLDCKTLINEFSKAKKNTEYNKLYSSCNKEIQKMLAEKKSAKDLNTKYGPYLDVLYYIAGTCKILIENGKNQLESNEIYLSEGIKLTSSPELKDLYRLSRAVMRLSKDLIAYGRYDLSMINDKSICCDLQKEIIQQVDKHIKIYPALKLEKNKEIETLLNDLKSAILKDNKNEISKLKNKFKSLDETKIDISHVADYYQLITMHYFKLREGTTVRANSGYNQLLLICLKKSLINSYDPVEMLFKFKDIISEMYGDNDKRYLKIFRDDFNILLKEKAFKAQCNSFSFHQFVDEYCKELEEKTSLIGEKKINSTKKKPLTTKADLQKLNNEIRETENKQRKINKKQDEISRLIKDIDALQMRANALKVKLPEVHEKFQIIELTLMEIRRGLDAQSKLPPVENDLAKCKTEIEQSTNEIIKLEDMLNKKNEEQRKINKKQEDIRQLVAHTDILHTKANSLKIKLPEAQERLDEIKLSLTKIKQELTEQSKLPPIENDLASCITRLKESKNTMIKLVDDAMFEKNNAISKMRELEIINRNLAKVDEAVQQMDKVKNIEDEIKQTITKLNQHISSKNKTIQDNDVIYKLNKFISKNFISENELIAKDNEIEASVSLELKKVVDDTASHITQLKTDLNNTVNNIRKTNQKITSFEEKIRDNRSKAQSKDLDITTEEEKVYKDFIQYKTNTEDALASHYIFQTFHHDDDFNILFKIYNAAHKMKRDVIVKGSFFAKWYLSNIWSSDSIEHLDSRPFNDIDISIDCIDTDYNELLDVLIPSRKTNKGQANPLPGPFDFKIINQSDTYINLNKKLKNGLTLDLTLKIANDPSKDFIPLTIGEGQVVLHKGKFILRKNENNKSFVTITHADGSQENRSFASFEEDFRHGKTEIGLPDINTKNYAYRLYKFIKRYKNMIKITNLADVKKKLTEYYITSLNENRMTIHLELSDFVKHKALNADDKDAVQMLELIFNVFFQNKPNVDVSEFVKFFISCKDDLYSVNKTIFKEQIDLMRSLHLEMTKLDVDYLNYIRNEIKKIKLLYLQSISQSISPVQFFPPAYQVASQDLLPLPQGRIQRGRSGHNRSTLNSSIGRSRNNFSSLERGGRTGNRRARNYTGNTDVLNQSQPILFFEDPQQILTVSAPTPTTSPNTGPTIDLPRDPDLAQSLSVLNVPDSSMKKS